MNTLCGDLSTLSPEEVADKINHERVDVIIGGPPCQGFSVAGKRIVEDKRNELYKSFVNLKGETRIREVKTRVNQQAIESFWG